MNTPTPPSVRHSLEVHYHIHNSPPPVPTLAISIHSPPHHTFGRRSLFPSWSGYGLISTLVAASKQQPLKDYYPSANYCCVHYRTYQPNITSLRERRAFTSTMILRNLNGTDLQKLHNLPKNINLLYSLQLSFFHFISCNF